MSPSLPSLRSLLGQARSTYFIAAIFLAFLIPALIPGEGLDYPYLFIMCITLFAWFVMQWEKVKSLETKGRRWEVLLGLAAITADYAENAYFRSEFGLIDMLIVFSALVAIFYGLRAFRLFWVPATYGIVLLLGYQLENNIPNYVALQDWMAGVMVSSMHLLGIPASAQGHIVALNTGPKTLLLDVESDCTGIQGVLAFGMLSTMALLDTKPAKSRLAILLAIGFVGVFLINILRLIVVFLTFEFLGVDIGTTVHVYAGYVLFIAWVLVFWSLAFRYMTPRTTTLQTAVALKTGG